MTDKKILIFFSIIFLLFFAISSFATAAETEKVVFYNGVKLYGKLNDNSDFEVSLFMVPFNDKIKYNYKFWGYDKLKPRYVIKELSVIVRRQKLIIPQDAIKDLADINLPCGLYLMQTTRTIVLYIEGGDAESAYEAALKFVNNRLVSRTIEFGESDSVTTKY
ncbi:MAG: hypothetical protein MUP30_09890 [Deltaproteobacteria bacterium]|nr:hypothetical protein [Deltaproteobacteria bacterium]